MQSARMIQQIAQQIAWLRQQNDDMTQQLVWFADKIGDAECTQNRAPLSTEQKQQIDADDTPNTPKLLNNISLISEMSLNDTISTIEDEKGAVVADDDCEIDDIDVLTVRSIGYIEEVNGDDVKQLIQKCTNREPVRGPKLHRRRKKSSNKKKNEWFWLLGRS